jgi:hypothetical protein
MHLLKNITAHRTLVSLCLFGVRSGLYWPALETSFVCNVAGFHLLVSSKKACCTREELSAILVAMVMALLAEFA